MNIFLDGDFAFGLDKEVALEHKLNEGEKLTESEINKILYDENKKKAKQKVLHFLNYRARSIKEIRNKLREKEIPGEIIDEVIGDFIRVGLLDDEKFGAAFVRTRMVKKKVSKRFLLRELKEKGFQIWKKEKSGRAIFPSPFSLLPIPSPYFFTQSVTPGVCLNIKKKRNDYFNEII
ncbi:MAG: RecX family transcriptional regulator [bacterium]